MSEFRNYSARRFVVACALPAFAFRRWQRPAVTPSTARSPPSPTARS